MPPLSVTSRIGMVISLFFSPSSQRDWPWLDDRRHTPIDLVGERVVVAVVGLGERGLVRWVAE